MIARIEKFKDRMSADAKQGKLITIGVAVSFLILAVIGWHTYSAMTEMNKTRRWVGHTYETLMSFDRLYLDLEELQASQRQYLITGKEADLDSYKGFLPIIEKDLSSIKRLTADNRQHQENLKTLEVLIGKRTESLDINIKTRREQGLAESQKRVIEGTGPALMRQIGEQIGKSEEIERKLLKERLARADKYTQRTKETFVVGTAVSFAILIMIFILLEREVRRRKRSEERFSSIVKASTNIVYNMNADWSKLHRLRGGGIVDEGKFSKTDWMSHIPPEDRPKMVSKIQEAIKNKILYEFEHRLYFADGSIGWVFSRAVPIIDDKGQIVEWFGIGMDITKRKKAEEALRQSEFFYRQTLESIPGMVFTTTADGYCDYSSQQWTDFTGVAMEENLGNGWQKLVHPEDLQMVCKTEQKALEEKGPFSLEFRLLRHDGEYEWVKVRGSPIRDETGKIVKWIGLAININEMKQAEIALGESEEKFRSLAQNAQAVIGIVQGQKFVYANPYFVKTIGYSEEEILSMNLAKMVHPDYRRMILEKAMLRQSGKEVESHYEFLALSKSQEEIWFDVSTALISYRGKPAVAGIGFNITERKKAEIAFAESEERFRVLAENAQAMIAIVQGEKFIYVNPYTEQVSGYSKEELLKMNIKQIIHPDHRDMVIERARLRQEGKEVESHYEFLAVSKTNEPRWLDFSSALISYRGKPAIVGIAFDITERKRVEEELRISERRFRKTFENAIVGITHLDINGNWLLVNDRFCEMLGYSKEAMMNTEFSVLTYLDDVEQDYRQFQLLSKGEIESYVVEKRYVHKDGSIIWTTLYRSLVRDQEGKPQYSGTIVVDITDRKRAERALLESEEKFRILTESAEAAIGIVQGQAFVYVNPYLVQVSGYSEEELLNINIAQVIHPDYRQMVLERARLRQEGKEVESHYEFLFISKTNQQIWFDFSPALISYRGKPAIVGIAFDITERKNAEEELQIAQETLRQSHDRLKKVLEVETVGVMFWDLETGRLVDANDAFLKIMGYDRGDVESGELNWQRLTPPEYVDVSKAAIRDCLATGRFGPFEKEYIRKDGSHQWFTFAGSLIGNNSAVEFCVDISKLKQVENDLRTYKDQLENKVKEMETIVGVISHDLRTPLLNVRGFGKVLEGYLGDMQKMLWDVEMPEDKKTKVNTMFSQDIKEAMDYIDLSAKSMNNLIESLVKIARAGLVVPKPQQLNMNHLLKDVVDNLTIKFKDTGAKIMLDKLPECFADATHVTQIFTNLIDNALKYLDPARQGDIRVYGYIEHGRSIYVVSDNGIGVDEQDQQKIFDIFYQVGRKAGGGEGMGLATVKRLTERNEGKIWMESEKDKGSTFFVELPGKRTGQRIESKTEEEIYVQH